jgi:hypothetical protein
VLCIAHNRHEPQVVAYRVAFAQLAKAGGTTAEE